MLSHSNLQNGLRSYEKIGSLFLSSDNILQVAGCAFDLHAVETMGSLSMGSTTIMLKHGGNLDLEYFTDVVIKQRVTCAFIVPTMAIAWLEHMISNNIDMSQLSHLRCLIFGGEAVPVELVRRCHEYLKLTEIINGYGPAECFVLSAYYRTTYKDDKRTLGIPIGSK